MLKKVHQEQIVICVPNALIPMFKYGSVNRNEDIINIVDFIIA